MDEFRGSDIFDVLILGAGAAGLAAAATLKRAGKRVKIVEARARWGGRVFTQWPTAEFPVELGAEFIHGKPDVLKAFVCDANAVPDNWWRRAGEKLLTSDDSFKKIEEVFLEIGKQTQLPDGDESFDQAIGRVTQQFPAHVIEQTRAYVTGFYSAPLEAISRQAVLDAGASVGNSESDDTFRLRSGYVSVLDPFASALAPIDEVMATETVVKEIHWSRSEVLFKAVGPFGHSVVYQGKSAVITLPLGCWDRVVFNPPLVDKTEILSHLGMGSVHKVVLRFKTPFWERADFHPGYVQSAAHPFVTFWTGRPWAEPRFTCWSGGSQTLGVREDREKQACEALAAALGVGMEKLQAELVQSHYHDWSQDPFSGGSYSFPRPGGKGMAKRLAEPVEGTLFFAGEACHPKDRTGTVDGAIETGFDAAEQVIFAKG